MVDKRVGEKSGHCTYVRTFIQYVLFGDGSHLTGFVTCSVQAR